MMPTRCVAAACSNTHRDHVSLFRFPRDPNIGEKWTKQVQCIRAKWKPTGNSLLCSKHFEENCFEPGSDIAAQFCFGIKLTRKLKPDAIPSGFFFVLFFCGKKTATTDSSVYNVAPVSYM